MIFLVCSWNEINRKNSTYPKSPASNMNDICNSINLKLSVKYAQIFVTCTKTANVAEGHRDSILGLQTSN